MNLAQVNANFTTRQGAVTELHALADTAEGREYTAEEQATEVRLNSTIATCDERITEGMRQLEADAASNEARSRFEGLFAASAAGAPEASVPTTDVDTLRALLRGEVRAAEFSPAPLDQRMALAIDPGSNGEASLVVPTVYERLHEVLREFTTIIEAGADVWRTAGGERITQPKVTGYSTAAIVGEAAPIPYSDPSFAPHFTIDAYKYAFLTKISNELVADSFFDIVGFLARQGGESLAAGIGAHLMTGTGVDQPHGALFATVGKNLATATITGDDLIDVYHSITSVHRKNAVWAFNDLTVAAIRKLKDSTGQYIWQPGLTLGAPDTILGRPVHTDVGIPAIAAASKIGFFGDLKNGYVVRFAGPLRIERSDEYAFNTDEIVFRFIQRADGEIMDDAAFKVITVT